MGSEVHNVIIFIESGKKVSMYLIFLHEHRLFSHLNFPHAVILNFCDVIRKKGFRGLQRDSNPWPLR